MDNEFGPVVRLGIWIKSIGNDTAGREHKALLNAVQAASVEGKLSLVTNSVGAPIAAVVPLSVLRLAELDFPVACDNGCPEGFIGVHKFSCPLARVS